MATISVASFRQMSDYYEVKKIEPIGHGMLRGFLIGIASGLGAVIGATIVLGSIVYILSHVNFVPVLGGYLADIANYITDHQRAR